MNGLADSLRREFCTEKIPALHRGIRIKIDDSQSTRELAGNQQGTSY